MCRGEIWGEEKVASIVERDCTYDVFYEREEPTNPDIIQPKLTKK